MFYMNYKCKLSFWNIISKMYSFQIAYIVLVVYQSNQYTWRFFQVKNIFEEEQLFVSHSFEMQRWVTNSNSVEERSMIAVCFLSLSEEGKWLDLNCARSSRGQKMILLFKQEVLIFRTTSVKTGFGETRGLLWHQSITNRSNSERTQICWSELVVQFLGHFNVRMGLVYTDVCALYLYLNI